MKLILFISAFLLTSCSIFSKKVNIVTDKKGSIENIWKEDLLESRSRTAQAISIAKLKILYKKYNPGTNLVLLEWERVVFSDLNGIYNFIPGIKSLVSEALEKKLTPVFFSKEIASCSERKRFVEDSFIGNIHYFCSKVNGALQRYILKEGPFLLLGSSVQHFSGIPNIKKRFVKMPNPKDGKWDFEREHLIESDFSINAKN